MPYDLKLADKIREYLRRFPELEIDEKKMFGGLAFMVNGKMCVNVSGQNLMCRFEPTLKEKLSKKPGYLPMLMKGKVYEGYCYVEPKGFRSRTDFEFWLDVCLDFNDKAKSSK